MRVRVQADRVPARQALAHEPRLAPSVSRETIVLAAIVPRVPGMTLTTGLAEPPRWLGR